LVTKTTTEKRQNNEGKKATDNNNNIQEINIRNNQPTSSERNRKTKEEIEMTHPFIQALKKPELMPLFFFIGGASLLSVTYTARLAFGGWDVSWKRNAFPYQDISHHDEPKLFLAGLKKRDSFEIMPGLNSTMTKVKGE
jgi:hypothetical protein